MTRLLGATAILTSMTGAAFAEAHMGAFPQIMVSDGQSYLASDIMGQRIYAIEAEYDPMVAFPAGAQMEWDDIGEIGDVVISVDGKLQAVILDVGGFLGIGEREVAVSWDAIKAVREDDDPSEVFLTINATEEMLESAPEFERMAMMDAEMHSDTEVVVVEGDTMADVMMDGERTMLRQPMFEREGYEAVMLDELTSEDMTGMRVYGAGDEDVGEISELIMSDDGSTVSHAILDIGGFLGLGEHQVRVTLNELQILRGEGGYRAYIDATQEELEAQPEYEG